LSASVVSQVTQPVPSVPQLESDAALHVAPEQHPAGQEVELQTHIPPEHTCPAEQGGADPQVQAPLAEHLSVLVGSHAVHVTPPSPHVVKDGVSHVVPEQQPDVQLTMQPLQLPDERQVCGDGHDWQAPPPLPHATVLSPGWQV
jgi:hypothetical protein